MTRKSNVRGFRGNDPLRVFSIVYRIHSKFHQFWNSCFLKKMSYMSQNIHLHDPYQISSTERLEYSNDILGIKNYILIDSLSFQIYVVW